MSDGHSTYYSFTFVLRWTFTTCSPMGVEMYNVTAMRIVIEFWKRSEPGLHSFQYNGHSFHVGYLGVCSKLVPTQGIRRIFG